MRSLIACCLLLAACPSPIKKTQCMTVGGKSQLVTDAKLLKLDIYPDTIACDGADVPPGSVPLLSHTFKPGEDIKLDVPPGKRTLVLSTFGDDAGTMLMGTGCTTTDLSPGAQVCINLTVMPAPDIAMPEDLSTNDIASCQGTDCPCSTSPDSCPAGQFCDGTMCQLGCKEASDCVGVGPANDGGMPRTSCNTTSHMCVECNGNSDCPLGKLCSPSGVCTVGCDATHACPGGLACCNSLCVDTTTDVNNCGSCGNPCNVGGATTCCSSMCVNLNSNADNCGSCGRACSSTGVATRTCATGKCTPTCVFGKGDCNNSGSNPANDGCETDLTTTANCGQCNQACAPVNAQQSASSCRFVPDGGAGLCQYTCIAPNDDCNKATPPNTDGCEVNLNSNKNNCSACGNVCDPSNNSGTACSGGTCGYTSCNTNQADCSQTNHNLDECETNANTTTHCGSCGGCLATSAFITSATCSPGTPNFCSYTCNCSSSHNSARTCDGTTCSFTCSSGFRDCKPDNAGNSDGCECPVGTLAVEGAPACCTGNTCQAQHDTGISTEHWYDCTPRDTYADTATATPGSDEALAACKRHNGGSAYTGCSQFVCQITNKDTGDGLWCDNSGAGSCNCWDFARFGTFPGGPSTAAGKVDVGGCNCPSGSTQWH